MSIVSLVIPVYNAGKYLEQCLDSVVKQTIFPDMEIITVNDGSTDNSLDILNRYSDRYPNIKVYTQENKGIALTRKEGYSHCSGDYIAMMDDDDFAEPDMYEKLLKSAKENDADYVYCNYSFYPAETSTKSKWFKKYRGGYQIGT